MKGFGEVSLSGGLFRSLSWSACCCCGWTWFRERGIMLVFLEMLLMQ